MEIKILKEKYKTGAVLKEDSLSVLYEGQHLKTGQNLWLEYFKGENLNEGTLLKLTNLAGSLVHLEHPQIVRILDFFTEETGFWLVSEAVRGTSLAAYLKEKQKLSSEEALEIVLDVVQALFFAGLELVPHGNLNLEDIWLTQAGQAKVCGFALKAIVVYELMTRLNELPLKGIYFAPEQFKGEFLREASDLYALGVIFYQMLAGQPPFDAENNAGLAHKHQFEEPDFSLIEAPGYVKEIIVKLLKKEPQERFSSWEDLIQTFKEKGLLKEKQPEIPVKGSVQETPPRLKSFKMGEKIPQKSGVLVFFLLGIFLGLGFGYFFKVPVPDFSTLLKISGPKPREVAPQSENRPALNVGPARPAMPLSPAPAPGNGPVLEKKAGPAQVILPNLRQQDFLKAQQILNSEQLILGRVVFQKSKETKKNLVLGQNPAPGREVSALSPVDLVVGGGRDIPHLQIHYAAVEFILPAKKNLWPVEIKVQDSTGLHFAYQRSLAPGQPVSWTVLGVGPSHLKIYLDGQLIKESQF